MIPAIAPPIPKTKIKYTTGSCIADKNPPSPLPTSVKNPVKLNAIFQYLRRLATT